MEILIKLIFIHHCSSQLLELTGHMKKTVLSYTMPSYAFLPYRVFPFNISEAFQVISKNAVQQPAFEIHTLHLPMVFPREDK